MVNEMDGPPFLEIYVGNLTSETTLISGRVEVVIAGRIQSLFAVTIIMNLSNSSHLGKPKIAILTIKNVGKPPT